MQRDARVALSIVDETNPYRYPEIRGTVERIDPDPDKAFINSVAKKYMGRDVYPGSPPSEERVVVIDLDGFPNRGQRIGAILIRADEVARNQVP